MDGFRLSEILFPFSRSVSARSGSPVLISRTAVCVTRMYGGVGGGSREATPYPDGFYFSIHLSFSGFVIASCLSENGEPWVDLVKAIPADHFRQMDIFIAEKRLKILVDRLLTLAGLLDQRGIGETSLPDRNEKHFYCLIG